MPEPKRADLSALSDLRTPWCLHVVVTLHIAEHIAAGSERIDELARAAGCDAEALQRVLGHLVSKGVFEETAPGRFGLNEAARELLDPGMRLGLDLEGIGGRMAYAWGTLLSYVRTGAPAYQVSKAALHALTRTLAAELRSAGILVNAVCPGWTATDMGGPGGRPVADGAASVVWGVTLPDDGPTGGFFRDGRRLPW